VAGRGGSAVRVRLDAVSWAGSHTADRLVQGAGAGQPHWSSPSVEHTGGSHAVPLDDDALQT